MMIYLRNSDGCVFAMEDANLVGTVFEFMQVITEAEYTAVVTSVSTVVKVPQTVTPRQARLALLQATLLDEVELLLVNDKAMQIWWEYSLEIERNHQHISVMGLALGLTSVQLDNLFILAGTL